VVVGGRVGADVLFSASIDLFPSLQQSHTFFRGW